MNEILALLERHGGLVVFVFGFLEQIGAPVPAIPVLIVAGAVAAVTGHSILMLLLLAVAGALIADLTWFFLGRRYGYRVLGLICRVSLSPDSCVRKTETFFDRWGYLSLVFAKFVPGYSIVAPPLAGAVAKASLGRFLVYDGAGAVIWAGSSLLAGVIFRGAIDRLLTALGELGGWALVLLGAVLLLFILFKWWERRRFYRTLRIARIAPRDLREQIVAGAPVVILDVRTGGAQARDPRRLPGARLVTADDLEVALRGVDRGEEIILYCT